MPSLLLGAQFTHPWLFWCCHVTSSPAIIQSSRLDRSWISSVNYILFPIWGRYVSTLQLGKLSERDVKAKIQQAALVLCWIGASVTYWSSHIKSVANPRAKFRIPDSQSLVVTTKQGSFQTLCHTERTCQHSPPYTFIWSTCKHFCQSENLWHLF